MSSEDAVTVGQVEAAWVAGELAGRQALAHSLMSAEKAALGQQARAEKAEALAEKYKWQVIDTCMRAEKAEAELSRLSATRAQPATKVRGISLGDNQWKTIATAAVSDFVRVPVHTFARCAVDWRWLVGIVPQTSTVAQRCENLEQMFCPPSDVDDAARAALSSAGGEKR